MSSYLALIYEKGLGVSKDVENARELYNHGCNGKIEWAEVAEKDLKGIVEYIAEDSPANALNILRKIKQQASSLYTLPERGRYRIRRIRPGAGSVTTGFRDRRKRGGCGERGIVRPPEGVHQQWWNGSIY